MPVARVSLRLDTRSDSFLGSAAQRVPRLLRASAYVCSVAVDVAAVGAWRGVKPIRNVSVVNDLLDFRTAIPTFNKQWVAIYLLNVLQSKKQRSPKYRVVWIVSLGQSVMTGLVAHIQLVKVEIRSRSTKAAREGEFSANRGKDRAIGGVRLVFHD